MTKKKSTKRALISSLLILAMCFTMLAGTTFAWFTDSVESGNNIIKSGKLDIDLLIKADGDADYVSVTDVPTKAAFDYDLWEPGYTSWANAKVVNKGNLALKYTMKIAATGEVSKLAEVIDVYYAASEIAKPDVATAGRPADLTALGLTKIGTLKDAINGTVVINDNLIPDATATEVADYATIVLHMQEEAGNEYQELSIGSSFKFVILATQYTYEADAFDDQYDKDAEYPAQKIVDSAEEFTAALGNNEIDTVTLNEDISVSGPQAISGKTLDGQGNTITVSNTGSDCGLNAKSGTIENVTVTGTGRGIGTGSSGQYAMDGDLYIDNVTVDGPTYAMNIGKGNNHKLIATNSTFLGWTSMDDVDATFTNCTFGRGTNGGAANYAYFAIYDNVTFNNCAFSGDFQFFGRATSTGTITLNNCTHGGEPVTAANFVSKFDKVHDSDFDYLMNNCVIIVDGVRVNP
ncbi:MAG: hypothetical protein J5441_03120 [Clostridia bacterium]|nr:hypothetical protein [Clostridia bacterium]